ncbi:MAG: lipopolysaccharide biosynthesis protein RfbH [Pseudomonadota bacterium]|uniref:lipopolysaccharide biosynthesis protein RfbH n=1 Tax=Roseovarius TaxID=74030 RepID=UPI0022A6BACD|nr:lipopolysaccharide biosynthesis protein RfbH [Roseovarius sp. EGI FJ00037]MCZ0811362.1 lipopolysaccharide biosynthesis protein RfbH [Roseovarius sp. EGI FJ00037]
MELLRSQIIDLAKRHMEQQAPPAFIPGETYIPVSGKIVDAADCAHLIDASLDMFLTSGRYAAEFETKLARRFGRKLSKVTVSGSAANLLAFTTLTSPKLGDRRIAPGSEVITVAGGFPTTVTPIIQNGCVPVFVDLDLDTHNVDVDALEDALTEKTRAVMIAHSLGNPFDVARVSAFCARHDLFLIEDCCDAFGARLNGRNVGTFGDLATLSFYPAHHITMGEGGAVLMDRLPLARICESFRDWGRDCYCHPGKDNTCGKRFDWQLGDLPAGYDHKYIYSHIGYNMKITDMQAALGVSQLDKLDGFIAARNRNFDRLTKGLRERGLDEFYHLPRATTGAEPSWFGYLLTIRDGNRLSRRDVTRILEDRRIGTRLLFAGNLTRQPAFRDVEYRVHGSLDITDKVMRDAFWLGVWPGIDQQRIDYMVKTLADITRECLQ